MVLVPTDSIRAAYLRSDRLGSLEVPADDRLRTPARCIEKALNAEQSTPVRKILRTRRRKSLDFSGPKEKMGRTETATGPTGKAETQAIGRWPESYPRGYP
jgi:hypothetical protein